jgi:hypothetical protein
MFSFRAEGFNWVNPGGAAGGKPGSNQSDGDQEQRGKSEREGIIEVHARITGGEHSSQTECTEQTYA